MKITNDCTITSSVRTTRHKKPFPLIQVLLMAITSIMCSYMVRYSVEYPWLSPVIFFLFGVAALALFSKEEKRAQREVLPILCNLTEEFVSEMFSSLDQVLYGQCDDDHEGQELACHWCLQVTSREDFDRGTAFRRHLADCPNKAFENNLLYVGAHVELMRAMLKDLED